MDGGDGVTGTLKSQRQDILETLEIVSGFTIGPNASLRQKAARQLEKDGLLAIMGEPGELLVVSRPAASA
jgi:hypothetical protein